METDSDIKPPDKSWRNALLPESSTIQDAVENLNNSALQIVLVINDNTELVGTISDGDIRRGLLRGLNLKSPAMEIVQRKPMVVENGASRLEVQILMSTSKIQQIPIVDDGGKIVSVHFWDAPPEARRESTFVIMAGGLGTRLWPHTNSVPKGMLTIAGKPMLEHIISQAIGDGFRKFNIAIRHLGHIIENYFGNGSKFGVEIEYIRETTPLGTAGALSLLNPRPKHPFVVSNCDVMSNISYGRLLDFHVANSTDATMSVRSHEWVYPYGVVEINGIEIVGITEKPISRSNINAGVYVLNPSVLDYIVHDQHCDMTNLFDTLRASNKRTIGFPIHESWLDVGSDSDLVVANRNTIPSTII